MFNYDENSVTPRYQFSNTMGWIRKPTKFNTIYDRMYMDEMLAHQESEDVIEYEQEEWEDEQ